MLQNWLPKVTDFITKKCYKIDYKKLLTSWHKNVTKVITGLLTSLQNVLQNLLQKVTDFITKNVTKFITKVTDFITTKMCYQIMPFIAKQTSLSRIIKHCNKSQQNIKQAKSSCCENYQSINESIDKKRVLSKLKDL